MTNDNTGVPWIIFSHLPFARSRLLEHERTKGCDALVQVARLKTVLVTNAALKICEGTWKYSSISNEASV